MHDPKSIFAVPRPPIKRSDSGSLRPRPRRRYSESAWELRRESPDFRNPLRFSSAAIGDTTPASGRSPAADGDGPARHTSIPRSTPSPTLSAVGASHRSQPAAPTSSPRAGNKRTFEGSDIKSPRPADSLEKRYRKRLRRDGAVRHTLGALDAPSGFLNHQPSPPSPLFFSNSPQTRPPLPPRFSSSEAAIKMLNRAQKEEQGIKTVTLPRATMGSPPTHRPASVKSRMSSDRKSYGRATDSPDSHDRYDQVNFVNQIGITEFLEQDERPTFIVDLNDPSNHISTGLQIVYINAALRLYSSILDCVTGRVVNDETLSISPHGYSQFKSWVLAAYPVSDQSKNDYTYGAVSWSSSTLRKRIRIISGNAKAPSLQNVNWQEKLPLTVTSSTPDLGMPSVSSTLSNGGAYQDYFGAAALSPSEKPTISQSLVLPSVEQPLPDIASNDKTLTDGLSATPGERLELNSVASTLPTPVIDLSKYHELSQERDVGFFDWTRMPNSDSLPPHIRFARSVDWASTALGPIETWSPDLRQMCNLIMASPHPAAMYWGEDLVAIYNEAYVLLAGQKHPKLMGQSYREAWAEIWDEVKEVFANAQQTGEATMKDDDCLFIKRNDFLEEVYFSWSIIPMVGGDGSVMGLYNPAFEKTRRRIAERRMLTLREVGERTATARDVKSFWEEVLNALECNEFDTPFVLLYSLYDDVESDEMSINSSSLTSARQCLLEGALGVPNGHPAAPLSVDFQTSNEGFVPVFREVLKSNKLQLLNADKGELPSELLEGLEWRGFGDPARAAVICPIHPTTGESTLGFLVLGVNPRRPYDDDYNLFVQLLGRQLATSLASVVLFEEEIRRGQRAAKLAALDRIELSEQLAARTAQAIESETKFTRMAEMAPVGMLIADHTGRIIFCNDTWYEITRVPRLDNSTDRWIEYVHEKDRPEVEKLWDDLVSSTKATSAEFRFQAPWVDRNGVTGPTWVLFSAFPEPDEYGNLKSVFGSVTNISQQKWAEDLQKRKTEEAVELKRQQENFIDITSHEMRNPLSAILQCADEIATSVGNAKAKINDGADSTLFDDTIDAAQTIALCAQHQKRIVDDILTLSKLDSQLLMVTPIDAQPLSVAQRALKMFEGELQTADIQMKFVVDPSFEKMNIDWVRFDPSRVLQVLINLTTNAIKFTTTEVKRTICVSIAASKTNPAEAEKAIVQFVPTSRTIRPTFSPSVGWGEGEEIYIHFSVQDTGRGLSAEEKKLLFQRFSQASPRTHVQYGGSGLGLFISKQLTELQGGQIGVASEAGKGSTFAFFVKARRSSEPPMAMEKAIGMSNMLSPSAKGAASTHTPPKTRDFAAEHTPSKDTAKSKETLKVLIVEDNLVNQRVLQKQLKNMGCITHVANHGGEALDKLRESWFWAGRESEGTPLSVVLMDQEMPVMDGLTCTRKIRALEQEGKLTRHVPIIAVTANARSEQIETAMDAGMDDVVSKPFRIPDLIPKIEELVQRYEATEEAIRA